MGLRCLTLVKSVLLPLPCMLCSSMDGKQTVKAPSICLEVALSSSLCKSSVGLGVLSEAMLEIGFLVNLYLYAMPTNCF